jgi:hypothetical protein
LKKTKNQPPNTSHCQLAEVTVVPKSATARVMQQQEKPQDAWTLRHGPQGNSQNRKLEGKNQDAEEALTSGFISQLGEVCVTDTRIWS